MEERAGAVGSALMVGFISAASGSTNILLIIHIDQHISCLDVCMHNEAAKWQETREKIDATGEAQTKPRQKQNEQ